ncbi:FAD-dependent oxidoreductase [Pedomonas mirosovicensis]|uniref:FAD-dependent oxidoreductase n=1 Tax=Pedomonas mirosovicensis TaxID=2908641 RepID=UPI0021670BD1|nr:GMC family oxidoreductase [Pedomonas mirosovicensis]MCH8685419.1 GMC family oxidoreductase [Pedomonas mirosovicensis]
MLVDLHEAPEGLTINTDVCIVGSGVAGLTLARTLLAQGLHVCLLESGGRDHEDPVHRLNDGENTGFPYYELQESRLRLLGGTTAIWGGRLAELDPEDFEAKPWVAHSGWPISKDDLANHYRAAWETFEMPPEAALPDWLSNEASRLERDSASALQVGYWRFDTRFNRFTHRNTDDVTGHARAQVWLHATVTRIQAAEDGSRIDHVVARDLRGNKAIVQARQYVLAAGGIENARLLLASNDIWKSGLGNAYDQVGRYFMEHPHARGGRVETARSWPLLRVLARSHRHQGTRLAALLRPSRALQQREGILNTAFTLGARQPADAAMFLPVKLYNTLKHRLPPTEAGRRLWMVTKQGAVWLHERIDPLRPWLMLKAGRRELAIVVRAEQAPNPNSRVRLGRERDAFGIPKVELDWRFSDIDKRTLQVLARHFDATLRQGRIGRVEPEDWLGENGPLWQTDPLVSSHAIGGYHHMGSTRMSASPRTGVVDADCQVHGIDNLYVAGSSVFPTSGWANPTLTIAALAIRLGEHLAARSKREEFFTPHAIYANPRRQAAG